MELDGKVAIVTGGASGIGQALASELANQGARVVVGDLDEAGAQSTAVAIGSAGGESVSMRANAADAAYIEALITLAGQQFGPVDIYVANAGIIGKPGLGADSTVTLYSTSICARTFVRRDCLCRSGLRRDRDTSCRSPRPRDC